MNRLVYILILISIDCTECLQYDRFSGEKVDGERLKELRLSNATS